MHCDRGPGIRGLAGDRLLSPWAASCRLELTRREKKLGVLCLPLQTKSQVSEMGASFSGGDILSASFRKRLRRICIRRI